MDNRGHTDYMSRILKQEHGHDHDHGFRYNSNYPNDNHEELLFYQKYTKKLIPN